MEIDIEPSSRRSRGACASRRLGAGISAACVFLLVAAGVLALSPAASAAPPQLLRNITSEEAGAHGAGRFEELTGIGTDPRTGHIYGIDAGNSRVDEFTPWGEFVKAFGWDVAPGAVNEQQEVRVRAASGQFRLTFGADTTGNLAFDAPAAEAEEESGGPESVEAALNALPSISAGGGGVTVEGHPGNPATAIPFVYVVVFDRGPLVGADVSQLTASNGSVPLAGGSPTTELEASTRVDGTSGGTGLESCTAESGCKEGISGSGAGQIFGGPFAGSGGWGLSVDAAGNVYVGDRANHRVEKFDRAGRFVLAFGGDVVAQGPDNSVNDEQQEVTVAAASGSFKLGLEDPFGGTATSTTAALPYNATAAQVESAIEGLATVSGHGGTVSVSGGPGDSTGSAPYVVTFEGGLSGDDIPQLTIDRSSLGPATIGARLVCSSAAEAGSFEYAWLRNGEPIAGASSQSYTTTAADEGKAIQCQVTATNAAIGSVQAANPVYVAPPEPGVAPPVAPEFFAPPDSYTLPVGGAGGQTLTCRHGTWQSVSSFSYRWFRNGEQIAGATGETYVATSGDLATPAAFQCAAIGTNAGGSTVKMSQTFSTTPSPRPPAPIPLASMEPVLTVAQGGGPEVCRPAAGDTCKNGTPGTAAGQFSPWQRYDNLVSVAPDGTVFVGDRERIQRFEPDGSFQSQIDLPAQYPVSIASAPSGNLFADFGTGGVNNPPEPGVAKLSEAGAVLGSFEVSRPFSLAVDPDENVYAIDQSSSLPGELNEVLEFDSEGNPLIPEGSEFAGGTLAEPKLPLGLATNSVGDVIVASVKAPAGNRFPSYLEIYGPPPVELESPPRVPPEIAAQYAVSVGTDQAVLRAKINPRFWTDAEYQVEYGTSSCTGGGCTAFPAAALPLTESSLNADVKTAPLTLTGLTPGTTYHYRFVGTSSGGGPEYGPERTFRTYPSPAQSQADNRAYEMVSPGAKDGAEVGIPGAAGGAAEFSVQPEQASASGQAVTYASFTAFGHAEGAPAASQYLSTRGPAGWETQNIGPRFEEGYTRDPLVGFSSDLSQGAVIVIEPPLASGSYSSLPNLYLRDNTLGRLTPITTEPPTPQVTGKVESFCLMYEGASLGAGRVAFAANNGALGEGDPLGEGFNLYEWTPATGVRLLSVLPDGTSAPVGALTTVGSAGFYAGGGGFRHCNAGFGLMRHAVSADGSKVFWTYDGTYEGAKEPLFARLGGTQTIELDARQGLSGAGGEGHYQDASSDGSVVFFTDKRKLTTEATAFESVDLYRYDFSKSAGSRLTNITAHTGEKADVRGVIGSSDDGAYVYFVASGAIAGAAEPEQANLYAWHVGEGIRYIATLASGDSSDWASEAQKLTAQVSANGRHLAFLSQASLTGFANRLEGNGEAASEVYLYDFESGELRCASCNAAGTSPTGSAAVPTWSTPYQPPRYLSADGSRLFFTTPDALDPRDGNGRADVYEFELPGSGSCGPSSPAFNPESGGCDFLVSSGSSSDDVYLVDASNDGADIFFSTRDRLDPYKDQDERYDVYDARVNGTAPSAPPAGCQGSCPEGGSSPPASAPAATKDFFGPGNSSTETLRCRKGERKIRRHGRARCQKIKKRHRHKRRHKHHHRKKHGHKHRGSKAGRK